MRNRLPRQHYPRAPITEAVIDLRAELRPELSVAALQKVLESDPEKATYPNREALLREQFQFAPGLGASTTRHEAGFRFSSADGKYVFQARMMDSRLAASRPTRTGRSFERKLNGFGSDTGRALTLSG